MMSRMSRVTRGDSHCRGRWLPVSRSGVGGIAPAGEGRLGPFEHAIECREGEEIRKKKRKKAREELEVKMKRKLERKGAMNSESKADPHENPTG